MKILYAFTVEDEILYLGETTAGLGSRFESYRYGMDAKKDTDNTVKIGITEVLQAGGDVCIWAAYPKAEYVLKSGETIPLQVSKSLEYYLLQKYPTRLNKQHRMIKT